jgi:CheY-like chemotaxis protein
VTESTPRHILVADDEPHIGRIIKMKLEQGPFRVTLAYDGQEALDIVNNGEQIDPCSSIS